MSKRMKITPETKWHEYPIGAEVLDAGNAAEFKTGDWRSMKPVWNKEKCKNCMFCSPVCPDMAIIVEDDKMVKIDYDFCKGCGVCTSRMRT